MGIPEIRTAEADLADALAILERGRDGASEDWLKAANELVERCRAAYEQARRHAEESSLSWMGRWRSGDTWGPEGPNSGPRLH